MHDIIFHPDIRNEVQTAYDWYKVKTSDLGEEFLKELDLAFELIQKQPLTWPGLSDNFRKYLLKRFPFGVIYKVDNSNIYILAVMHLRRKPGYWKRRKIK